MKKTLLAAAVLCSFAAHSQSSEPKSAAFGKSSQALTAGYGMPNLFKKILVSSAKDDQSYFDGSKEVSYTSRGAGPFFLKYDYGVSDRFGLGLILGYYSAGTTTTYKYNVTTFYPRQTMSYTDVYTLDVKSFSVGARFNFHFSPKKKFDPYWGFGVGYTYTNISDRFDSDNPYAGSMGSSAGLPVYIGITLGFRYYVTDRIGLYAEGGIDKMSLLQAGLAFKLK